MPSYIQKSTGLFLKKFALILIAGFFIIPALAQVSEAVDTPAAEISSSQIAPDADKHQQELEAVEADLAAREKRRQDLRTEIEKLSKDRAELNRILIETTQKIGAAEERVTAIEQRVVALSGSEQAIRRSLEGRRDMIAEVLAALQRMGRHPPPAILVEPEDVSQALRRAILLGATVPELRAEVEALVTDLEELSHVRERITQNRQDLKADIETLNGEQERLAGLIEARQRRIAEVERLDIDESQQVSDLVNRTETLKDLIHHMERDILTARQAAEEAEKSDREREQTAEDRLQVSPFGNTARLEPQISFARAQGMLAYPVRGEVIRKFGSPDGYGGTTNGISIATRGEAVVSSPTDGWIVYSGPFRSFGQLLIINAGEGYYVLLAGMGRINVTLGQFVLAGEPVGLMGKSTTSASILRNVTTKNGNITDPVLYVEFRKDGNSIDPSPWWTRTKGEKARR